MPKSYRPEVIADSSGQWCPNGLRFATKAEAELNVADLKDRWYMVRETRVMESDDEPNYRWDLNVGLVHIVLCEHDWIVDGDNIDVCSRCGVERGEGR